MCTIHTEKYMSHLISGFGNGKGLARYIQEQPSTMMDFVITASLPSVQLKSAADLRRLVVEFLDILDREFEKRFDEKDISIWTSMDVKS